MIKIMAEPEILIGSDRTGILGALEVATGEESDPDVRLSPNSSSLTLGGGDGDYSDGDLRLVDRPGEVRIHASAGTGDVDPETTRVLVDGPSGRVRLGADGLESEGSDEEYDQTDIDLNPNSAGIRLGGGGGEYSEGDLRMTDEEGNVRIHASAGGGARDPETTAIYADGKEGSLHFRPEKAGEAITHPMLYMFSGPTDGSSRDWTSDEFPRRRPVVAHNPSRPSTGLLWDVDDSQFVFQLMTWEQLGDPGDYDDIDPGDWDIPIPSYTQPVFHQVLAVDMTDQRVGVNTSEPSHELDVDGDVNANNVESVSDARCKTNVEPVTEALETVRELRGVRFEWDEDGVADRNFDDERHLGFLAQELEAALPEAVSTDEDGLRSTAHGALTPVLVEAVKEQQAIIERQRDRIDRQDDALETLEDRVERLERRHDERAS